MTSALGELMGAHLRSVFGKSGKVALGFPIPPQTRYWFPPPTLHFLQRTLVRVVPAGRHFFQVAVLCLYDLISGGSMECEITRSTQLSTCHRLHKSHPFMVRPRSGTSPVWPSTVERPGSGPGSCGAGLSVEGPRHGARIPLRHWPPGRLCRGGPSSGSRRLPARKGFGAYLW